MDHTENTPDLNPSKAAQKQARVVEKFVGVMLWVTLFGFVVMVLRFYQYGWGVVPAIQTLLVMLFVTALLLRKRFPMLNVFALAIAVLIGLSLLGVVRFGLAAPTLSFLAVLPIVVTVVWGVRPGFLTLAAAMGGTFAISRLYLNGGQLPIIDIATYHENPVNWFGFIFISVVSSLLGILVAGFRLNYWRETNAELVAETKRRMASDLKRGVAEQWLESVAEAVPGVIFELELDNERKGIIRHISPGCFELWGMHGHEIEHDMDSFRKIFTPEHTQEFRDAIFSSETTGKAWTGRWKARTPQGEEKWIHVSGRPHLNKMGLTTWYCIALDVSNEVRAEQEARRQTEIAQQAERQKSIGQLTGGVAHDFNNILAIIMGNLEIMLEDLQQDNLREMIENCLEATERGGELTQSMLAFARKAPLDPTVLDINDVTRSARNWIGRTLPENIEVETSLLAGLWPVEADKSTTISALLNLILNARDAMPDGGKLTIETANVRIDQDYISAKDQDLRPGRYVMLAVSDTGVGISSATLENIFDPFFTTKGPGEGSGMGLPMVQGFIKQSGGSIQVYSEPGVGTTFKLYFHALGSDSVRPEKPRIEISADQKAKAHILVAEDEKGVRDNICELLEREGFQVTAAENGDEAFKIFENKPTFDLLLTDIVMPGNLQGTTLAKALRGDYPNLSVVFMTGYASEAAVHGNGLRAEDIRLSKPVRRKDLVKAVTDSLSFGTSKLQ
ncbi:response regulator [Falsihalocynthiibacter sp. CO-5D18]